MVALAEDIEPVEIADALRADQRRDSAAGDLERAAVDGLETAPGRELKTIQPVSVEAVDPIPRRFSVYLLST
jgi:hypothetical protein